ncbi:MAG: hypothetical protein ACT4QE_05765, partial [Anaerolineales bacterium]
MNTKLLTHSLAYGMRLLLAIALTAGWATTAQPPRIAEAAPEVTVKVTIQRIKGLDCFEELLFGCHSAPDFYAKIRIDNVLVFTSRTWNNDSDISPNWVGTRLVTNLARASIPVTVDVYDSDTGDDDHADLTPSSGRQLDLSLDIRGCIPHPGSNPPNGVAGDVTGDCGVTLTSRGTSNDRAKIWFKVEIVMPDSRFFEVLSATCAARIASETKPVVTTYYASPATPPYWDAYAVSGGDQTNCTNWQYVEISNPQFRTLTIRPSTPFVPGACTHSHMTYSVFGRRSTSAAWEYVGGGGMVGKWTG